MTLTAQQLQVVQRGEPLRFVDPDVNAEFVVLRADQFDRVRRLFDADDFDPREAMPLVWQAMKEDWEDPAMDVYDHYPEKP